MKIKKLFLIRHCSGAGSSTLAKFLSTYLDFGIDCSRKACHFEADMWMIDNDGKYKFDATRLHFCHSQCQAHTEQAMIVQEPVILVTNTFSRASEMKFYLDAAVKYGYDVVSIVLENRHNGQNIHSVPDSTLKKQELNIKNSLKLR